MSKLREQGNTSITWGTQRKTLGATVYLCACTLSSSIKVLRLLTKTLKVKQDLLKGEKIKGNKDKKNKMKPGIQKVSKYMSCNSIRFAKNGSQIIF